MQKRIDRAEALILALEDRFELNPRGRITIGLQLTQARRQLDDLIVADEGREALTIVENEDD